MNKGNTCRWIRILYKGSKTRNTVPLSPNVSAFLLCPGLLAPDWQVGVASSIHSICGNGKIIIQTYRSFPYTAHTYSYMPGVEITLKKMAESLPANRNGFLSDHCTQVAQSAVMAFCLI